MNYLYENNIIFSLDIGTRTIIGVVAEITDDGIRILGSEILEHKTRSMYDGQIHDINSVSESVKKVKQNLEEKLNKKLDKVAIAAAGRSLVTYRTEIEREIDSSLEIDKRLIESLEMEAIQVAQRSLADKITGDSTKYYCVGYTVVSYYLDGNFMEKLEGHRGEKIGIDVLATFLPISVVDSLYTVMDRVGLEVINLTLEPIAAIDLAVKKNLRLLNIALVDIGAGTSDIAISKDGTIIAYGMVPVAGDEITEKIAKTYLLDFNSAEKLKINLKLNEANKFTDIFGMEHDKKTEEILNDINEAIKELANEISSKILELNTKAPSAVFLIGGGSQLPRLNSYIAEMLGLQKERVAVRNTSIIEDVINIPEQLKGPDAITPIGIGLYAIKNMNNDFIEICLNDNKIKLINTKKIKVSDVLTFTNFNPRKLIPRRGKEVTYYINGKQRKVYGQAGDPAEIYINEKPATFETELKNGDIIKVVEATVGKDAEVKLFDCVNFDKKVVVNNKIINLVLEIKVNGLPVSENIKINNGDIIETKEIKNIKQLLEYLQFNSKMCRVYRFNKPVEEDYILQRNDIIEVRDDINEKENMQNINSNKKVLNLTINGKSVKIEHNKNSFIFVDIFDYIDIDLTKPQGDLILNVNGTKAEFTQELKSGDILDVYWKQ